MKRSPFFQRALGTLIATACMAIAAGSAPRGQLALHVTLVTSEHSRDSSSVTRNFTVSAKTLVYEETYHGARANRHQPVKKEYKLTAEDRSALIRLLKSFPRTETITRSSNQGATRDFELSIHSKLAGRESAISIQAPRTATDLRNDRSYRNSVEVIEQLYRIINRTDADIAMPELID